MAIALLQKCLNQYKNGIPESNPENEVNTDIPYYITEGETIDILSKKSKFFYKPIVKLKKEKTYMEHVWTQTIQTEFVNTDFNHVNTKKIKSVKDNKKI